MVAGDCKGEVSDQKNVPVQNFFNQMMVVVELSATAFEHVVSPILKSPFILSILTLYLLNCREQKC